MTKEKHDEGPEYSSQELIQAGVESELRLLRLERKAETRLGQAIAGMEKDQTRLDKARERLEQSTESVDAAAAALREAQARRAAGPDSSL